MKIKNSHLLIMFALINPWTVLIAQRSDLESARSSVVKIKTTYVTNSQGRQIKEVGTATGWCWKEPTLVVTALHAVAGNNNIKVYRDATKYTSATIEKVLKEADLALLRLSSDLGLTPLKVQDASPNSTSEYAVWGFPHGVFSMQGDNIRFSQSLETTPTLNSILTGDKLKDELKTQGYPLPGAHIIRISSTIQPGHSGAPIFAKDGVVIGVADGGLRGGTARINWAMPAAYYVPKLDNSRDAIPGSPSLQTSLYSSLTLVDADASDEEQVSEFKKEAADNTIVNGTESISKTWTADYDQILGTMDQKDKADLKAFASEFHLNMSDTQYDIYEDFSTGATFTVPHGENFGVHDGGWFDSSNADGSLQYLAFSAESNSSEEAVGEVNAIIQNIFPNDSWNSVIEEGSGWNSIHDGFYVYTGSFSDNSKNIASVDAEVKGPYLLVVFMIHNDDLLESDDEYLKQYLHYSIGMQMSTFSTY